MSRFLPYQTKEKGCAQSSKIRAASVKPVTNGNEPQYRAISGDVLPDCLLRVAKGHVEREMLRQVYQHPYINTHQIQERLRVSNAAQYSRKLNKKLFKLGYQITKDPLKGHNRFWLWTLGREVSCDE